MSVLRLAGVRGVRVVGGGSALPRDLDPGHEPWSQERLWSEVFGDGWQAELERRGWSVDHAEREWGVGTRHVGRAGEGVHLAAEACRRAIAAAGLEPREVELVVLGTSTPPRITSSMSSAVSRELGLDAAALDVRAGGASGLVAWQQATLAIRHGARAALVVGVEVVPDFLAEDDVVHRALFSSAATALVLRDGVQGGLVASASGRATGEGRAFTVPGALPVEAGETYTFQQADRSYLESLDAAWDHALREVRGLGSPEGRRLVPYAVSRRQLGRVESSLERSVDPARDYLRDHGCTGAASPLHQVELALDRGELCTGDELDLVAVGGGIHWASMRWRV